MKAFLISGIGADQRMFDYIRLPEHFTVEHVSWELPLPDESIGDYAVRLFSQHHSSEPFVLIGISFGGVIAVEIAKKFTPLITIIISSIPRGTQLPLYYKIAGKMNLHKILPVPVFKWMTIVKQRVQNQSKQNITLLRSITRDGNEDVIKWGLDAVLKWENEILPENFFHIHGEQDTVFPIAGLNPTHTIPGGHMLVLEKPAEINFILEQILGD